MSEDSKTPVAQETSVRRIIREMRAKFGTDNIDGREIENDGPTTSATFDGEAPTVEVTYKLKNILPMNDAAWERTAVYDEVPELPAETPMEKAYDKHTDEYVEDQLDTEVVIAFDESLKEEWLKPQNWQYEMPLDSDAPLNDLEEIMNRVEMWGSWHSNRIEDILEGQRDMLKQLERLEDLLMVPVSVNVKQYPLTEASGGEYPKGATAPKREGRMIIVDPMVLHPVGLKTNETE